MPDHPPESEWRLNLLITGSIMLAVLMALLMAQVDGLQIRLQPTPVFIALAPPADEPLPEVALPAVSTPALMPTTAASLTPTGTLRATAVSLLARCGELPAGWAPYQVRAQDTLLSLAALSGSTTAAIVKANCIQNEFITAGMIIFLPVRPPTPPPCGPPPNWVRYRVQPGDTLSSLAVRTNSSIFAIMQANCMESPALTAGRFIFLSRYPYTPPLPTNPPLPTAPWTATPTFVSPTASATTMVSPSPTVTVIFTGTATFTATPATPTVTGTPATPGVTLTPTATPGVSLTPTVATATATPGATATTAPTATLAPSATPVPSTATTAPTNTPPATAVPPSATP